MSSNRHIQIRSFILGGNHGQYLQAAGLAKVVRKLAPGSRVSHARYSNHYWAEVRAQTKTLLLPKFLAMQLHWARNVAMSKIDTPADIRIYGSDQIWSFSNPFFESDRTFFGINDNAHKIAYAPSMGHVPPKFFLPQWAADDLARFASIGVRDEATASAVENALGKRPEIVVDPALFLVDPDAVAPVRRAEIAVYCTKAGRTLPHLRAAMGELEANYQFKLYGYAPRRQAVNFFTRQFLMPEAVVDKIARSQLLFTSTFHGVMMALMTRTPFLALTSPSLQDRLLSPLGQTTFARHRLVDEAQFAALSKDDIRRALDPSDINDTLISELTQASRKWLSAKLSEAKI